MTKAVTVFTAVFVMATFGCYAQKLTQGSLAFLKGQEKLNVVFNYDDLMIQGVPENSFKETQGQKWADEWEEAKPTTFKERFLGHLNKNLNAGKLNVQCGDFPEAPYQATVRVLTVGRVWGISCEVVFTRTGDSVPLAKITVTGDSQRIGGIGGMGSNVYLTGTAFGFAGQNLGKFMAKKI